MHSCPCSTEHEPSFWVVGFFVLFFLNLALVRLSFRQWCFCTAQIPRKARSDIRFKDVIRNEGALVPCQSKKTSGDREVAVAIVAPVRFVVKKIQKIVFI